LRASALRVPWAPVGSAEEVFQAPKIIHADASRRLVAAHAAMSERKRWRGCTIARSLSCLLTGAVLALSPPALAREPTAEDRTTARALAFEGYQALHTNDYATAADRFKRADQLVHAPTLLVDLGRSYVGLGRLVEAHEVFQQVLREGVSPDAPTTWRRALVVAHDEDAKLEPRLAWVTIQVEGATEPHVVLGEEQLSPASLGVKRAVDPGPHGVVAEAEGFLPARGTIDLKEGELGELRLVLNRDPDYKPPPKADQVKRIIVVERVPPRHLTPAYLAYGVSGAGLLLSGVSSILMLQARSDLQKECKGPHCAADVLNAPRDVSKYHTFGTLAAVGLGVGLAGAGVGTYFLLSHPGKDEPERHSSVTAQLSPGYVGVSGRF
jgi:pentatricopeptide repeat protein